MDRLEAEGAHLRGYAGERTYKNSRNGFCSFCRCHFRRISQIEAGPDTAELARASAVLNRAGVRIMALEGGATIGVWSDLDGPEVRAALTP